MGPKSAASRPSAVAASSSADEPHPLQVIVIADTGSTALAPLTAALPACLVPIVGIPAIEYTLDALAAHAPTHVKEVFIFASRHVDLVQQYVRGSRYAGGSGHHSASLSGLAVHVVPCPEARSVGDILREVDSKSILSQPDFVLIHGDLVGPVPIASLIARHRENRSRDHNCIATAYLQPSHLLHPSRDVSHDSGIYTLDAGTHEIVAYAGLSAPLSSLTLAIPRDRMTQPQIRTHVSLRNDLIDAHIDICTLDVPALFTENFDYQTLRGDFAHGVLTSDLLGKTMYAFLLGETGSLGVASDATISGDGDVGEFGLAVRLTTPRTYHAAVMAMLRRCMFPQVPERMPPSATIAGGYIQRPRNVYVHSTATIHSSARIGPGVAIGPGCVVSAGVRMARCTIAEGCRISVDAVLEDSHIWQSVTIGKGTIVSGALLASGVEVCDNAVISTGCILAQGVRIGQGMTIPSGTRIAATRANEDENIDEEGNELVPAHHTDVVGIDGIGFVWTGDDSDDESDAEDNPSHSNHSLDLIGSRLKSSDFFDNADDTSDSEFSDEDDDNASLASSGTSASHDIEAMLRVSATSKRRGGDFLRELQQTLQRAFDEGHTEDIAALELNTLRMAYDANYADIRQELLRFVLADAVKPQQSIKIVMTTWAGLLRRITHSTADQADTICSLQMACSDTPASTRLFATALHQMYDNDVVEEEAVDLWWKGARSKQIDAKLREAAEPFVNWLNEAEEEDDSD